MGFGVGLSYTDFVYSDLTLSNTNIDETGSIDITLTVTNNGPYANASHSVLVFVYDMYRRVTPEYKLLKAFDKKVIPMNDPQTFHFSISAEDLQYVGIDSRYILEGGAYMLGVGADVDCRSGDEQDQLSMYGGANMCVPFNLTLSSSYNAVCDYGCALWSQGLCGVTVGSSECRAKCVSEAWSFNYVDCLQQYAQASCSGADEIQCYDAFSMTNTDSDDDNDNKNRQLYITVLLIVTAISCFLGGAAMSFCATHYYINNKSLKEPLLDTKYDAVPLNNNESLVNPVMA